ncbi:MAG: LuxR C-terminal-related transcriptional regulator [Cyclobacteriaceae bacterium]
MKKDPNATSGNYVRNDLYMLAGKPELSLISGELKEFIKQSSNLVHVLDHAPSFFFIIDFSRMQYLYVSDGIVNILGYTAEEWKQEGMDAAFRVVYADDKTRLKKLHADLFSFHFSVPIADRKKYLYTYDFRVVTKQNIIIWLMAQSSNIALDKDGKLSICFEICSDITHIKKNNIMTLSIVKWDSTQTGRNEKQFFYQLEERDFFTSRERQVLQLLSRGLSSKKIAGKLSISELTVFKHRSNMMKKAGVSNAGSLINYGLKNELL